MTLQERHNRFIKWRNDLEMRLARHIFNNNPKDEVKLELPVDSEQLKKLRPDYTPKIKVEVLESLTMQDAWEVCLNGRMVNYFSGPGAHAKATKRAGEIANESA